MQYYTYYIDSQVLLGKAPAVLAASYRSMLTVPLSHEARIDLAEALVLRCLNRVGYRVGRVNKA